MIVKGKSAEAFPYEFSRQSPVITAQLGLFWILGGSRASRNLIHFAYTPNRRMDNAVTCPFEFQFNRWKTVREADRCSLVVAVPRGFFPRTQTAVEPYAFSSGGIRSAAANFPCRLGHSIAEPKRLFFVVEWFTVGTDLNFRFLAGSLYLGFVGDQLTVLGQRFDLQNLAPGSFCGESGFHVCRE